MRGVEPGATSPVYRLTVDSVSPVRGGKVKRIDGFNRSGLVEMGEWVHRDSCERRLCSQNT